MSSSASTAPAIRSSRATPRSRDLGERRRRPRRPVRLGTRSSALALAQATAVAEALGDAELVPVKTADGEVGRQVALRSRRRAGDPRRRRGARRPLGEGPAGRAARRPRVGRGAGARGPRRRIHRRRPVAGRARARGPGRDREPAAALAAALAAPRPRGLGLRGNVDTRLARLAEGGLDGIVLAYAGLARLGREDEVSFRFAIEELRPAPGQGCLALEARRVRRRRRCGGRCDHRPGSTDRAHRRARRRADPGGELQYAGRDLRAARRRRRCSSAATPASRMARSGYATSSPATPSSRSRSARRSRSGC